MSILYRCIPSSYFSDPTICVFVGVVTSALNSNDISSYLGTNSTESICRKERETDAPWRFWQNEKQRNRCILIVSGSCCMADLGESANILFAFSILSLFLSLS